MTDLSSAISTAVDDSLTMTFEESADAREKIAEKIYHWLATEARKAPLPDLAERLNQMKIKIDKLSRELHVTFQGDIIKLEASTAESDITLTLLSRGSSWFSPHPSLPEVVIQALTGERQ